MSLLSSSDSNQSTKRSDSSVPTTLRLDTDATEWSCSAIAIALDTSTTHRAATGCPAPGKRSIGAFELVLVEADTITFNHLRTCTGGSAIARTAQPVKAARRIAWFTSAYSVDTLALRTALISTTSAVVQVGADVAASAIAE